jgi:epoxyqueuosine reductase QueG
VSLKDEVKKYALTELDMDYVGITDVDRLSLAPEGHRPTDILPGARSVIVMGVKLSMGAVQAIYRAHEDGLRHLQCIYGTHGYSVTPNYHLKFASYRMARFLEKKGFITTPLPSGPGGGGAPFSHRHAAVAAGLGEFGWSSIIVTPDAGPRVRFVSTITMADIEPDPFYSGERLCDRSKCNMCMAVCPSKAISAKDAKHVEMGGRSFDYGVVNFAKCRVSSEGLTTKSLGFKDLPIPENPTMAEVDKAREQIDPRQRLEVTLPVDRATWYCGKCLAYCPVGKKGGEDDARLHRKNAARPSAS